MVMPRSRSRSLESITRSCNCSCAAKVPAARSSLSTSVVLPWSTWAMMARLRRARGISLIRNAKSRALYATCAPPCCAASDQQPHERRGEAGGERAGDDGLEAQLHHFRAPLRAHRAQAADHDAEAAEIGEAAERVGHEQARALRELHH